MYVFGRNSAIALAVAIGGAVACAHPASAAPAKDIVIVHGALVDTAGWHAVHDILVKDGYRVTLVQEPNTGLAEDVAATTRSIDQQAGPVVLVGHSYAGSVITEAGVDSKVKSLVYVSALQPDVGEASGQLLQKFAPPNNAMMAASNRGAEEHFLFLPPTKFRANYAQDVPEAEARFLADSQQQLAEKALGAPVTVAAWRKKPSYAILTTQDHMVSPDLQRWMYKRSGSKVTQLAASHAAFVSQPAAVAKVIEAAAQ